MSEQFKDLPLLHIHHGFLSGDFLNYWSDAVRDESFWKKIDAHRHPEDEGEIFQPPHFVVNENYFNLRQVMYSMEKLLVSQICQKVESFYGENFVVGSQMYFRKWVKGYRQHYHLDHALTDGQLDFRSHGDEKESALPIAFHDVATVLYYNDDFEGGELTFLDGKISIKPTAGMLAVFPCTQIYGHGVNEILCGERYMSAHFWTRAKTMAMHIAAPPLGDDWRFKVRWPEKVESLLSSSGKSDESEV